MRASCLKAAMMGGVDGVITSFAIVAGASFTEESTSTAVVVGVSSLIADGLSMGVSEYVSSVGEAMITDRQGAPWVLGVACFACFVACGAIPLVAFLIQGLATAAGLSVAVLSVLGVLRARYTRESVVRGLVQTTGLGTAAGAVALGVALLASRV